MLLRYLLFPDFSLWVLVAIFGALAIALTVHEFSHALVAHGLGDDTARRQGRLTLNPIRHLDPMGSLMLLLVGFGWGKPVPVDHYKLKTNPKTGMALVALAGAGSNLALALTLALLWKVAGWSSPLMMDIIGVVIFYNVVLAIFNLIPIPPLDGFRVAVGVLPYPLARSYSRMELYGPAFLLMFIAFDWFIFSNIVGTSILGLIIRPFVSLFQHLAFSGTIPLVSGMV